MAKRAARKKSRSIGRLFSLALGVSLLVVLGFGLGLVVGVVSEEPELVLGHVAGRSTEVEWGARTLAGPAMALGDGDWRSERLEPNNPQNSDAEENFGLAPVGAGPVPASVRSARLDSVFSIQVGAFENADTAWSLAERLRNSGYPVRVLEPRSDERWRVRVGPVEGRATADKMAARLNSENRLPTWVLHEPGS